MRISPIGLGMAWLSLGMAAPAVFAAEPAVPAPARVEGFGVGVDAGALSGLRGGSTEVVEHMALAGTVDGNTADHVATGMNTIADGAFNGAVGVPMVIQNSGNNVLIQNATIINVQFRP